MPTAYAPLGRERGSRSSASVPSSIAGLLIAAGLLLLLNSAAFPSTAAAAAADDDFDQRLQALERVLHIDSVAGGEGEPRHRGHERCRRWRRHWRSDEDGFARVQQGE